MHLDVYPTPLAAAQAAAAEIAELLAAAVATRGVASLAMSGGKDSRTDGEPTRDPSGPVGAGAPLSGR